MKTSLTRLILGAGIILAGLAFLLANLGVYSFNVIWSDWWPVFVIAAGVVMFVQDTRNYLWSLAVSAFGVLLLLNTLGIVTVNPWELVFPIIVIVVGLSILLRRPSEHLPGRDEESEISDSGDDNIAAILGASNRRSLADDYRGGKVSAVLGGVKIDLRKATIKKEAVIDVTVFMGGVEVVVPRNVVVENNASAILGGVDDKTDQELSKNAPTLHIVGDVIMGGVEIKN